jgi:Putative Flp pilus-assembly TadE/G-like
VRRERGSVTLWGIGLVAVLFGFAGLAVDTWRVFTERQALAGLADSAAIAGANGIDEDAFRASGVVELDRLEARSLAAGYLAPRLGAADAAILFRDAGIEVILTDTVDLTMLSFFLGGEPVDLRVTAYATPAQRVAVP